MNGPMKEQKEQKDLLHKAIDLAEGPGDCTYTSYAPDLTAHCVVAKLAVMVGITAESMRHWPNMRYSFIRDRAPELHVFPEGLLDRLQEYWDSHVVYEDEALALVRAKMHQLVDEWYVS